jgi:hypothetical protein
MTADEVLRALGKPRSDNRAFGGGLRFEGLSVMLDTAGREIWTFTITGDTRLACGHGVGDTLAKVREGFPGGGSKLAVLRLRASRRRGGMRAVAIACGSSVVSAPTTPQSRRSPLDLLIPSAHAVPLPTFPVGVDFGT